MFQADRVRAEGKGSNPHCSFRNSSFLANNRRDPMKGLLIATEEDREQELSLGREWICRH